MSFDLHFLGDAAIVTKEHLREFFGGRAGYALLDDATLYDSEDTGVSFSFSFEQVLTESDGGRPVLPLALHVSTLGPSPFGLEAAEETEALVEAFGLEVWDPQSGFEGRFESDAFMQSWRAESRRAHDEAAAKDMDFAAHPSMRGEAVYGVWQWNRGHALLLASLGRQGDGVHVPAIICVKDPGGTPRAATAVEWKDAQPFAMPEVDVVILEAASGARSYIEWKELDPLISEWSEQPPQSRYAFGESSRTAGVAHHVLVGAGLREAFEAALSRAHDEPPEVLQWEQLVVGEFLARSVVRIAAGEVAEGTKRPDFYAELVVEDWNGSHAACVDGRGAVRRGSGADIDAQASTLRQARLIELVRVAGAILDTGFPDFEVGQLALGARCATVRVRAAAMGHMSEVAVTADRLGDVPEMQRLAGTIGGVLGDALAAWPPATSVEEQAAQDSDQDEPEPPTVALPMRFVPPSAVPITEEPTPEEEPPAMTQRGGTPALLADAEPPTEARPETFADAPGMRESQTPITESLAALDDEHCAAAALLHTGYRLAYLATAGLLTLPNEQGEPYGVVLTSDEAYEAVLLAWPHLRETVTVVGQSGRELFSQVGALGAAGLLVNPCGPGMAVLPADVCRRVAEALPPIRLTYQAGSEHDRAFGFGRTILELLDDGHVRIHNIDVAGGTRAWEGRMGGASLDALRDVVRRAGAMAPSHLELVAREGDPLRHVELWIGDQELRLRATWSEPRPYAELFRWLDSIVAQTCAPEDLGYLSSEPGLIQAAGSTASRVV